MTRPARTRPVRPLLAQHFLAAALIFPLANAIAAEERIWVPASGDYAGTATLDWSQTGQMPLFPPASSNESFVLEVSECGDSITVRHAELPQPIVTEFIGGVWHGEIPYQGRATIGLTLDSDSTHEVTALYHLEIPVIKHTQDWSIDLVTAAPATVPAGAGDIVKDPPEAEVAQGLWTRELHHHGMRIYDFIVGDATLLVRHKRILDEVAEIMTSEDWVADEGALCPLKPKAVSDTPVFGFASETGPDAYNRRLAAERARNTLEYLRQRVEGSSTVFPWLRDVHTPETGAAITLADGSLVRPVPGLLNLESACNRAAMYFFTMRQVRLDMYTKAQARSWLENDLRKIKADHAAGLAPGATFTARQQAAYARWEARSRYALAVQYLAVVEQQRECTPPGQRDPMAPGEVESACREAPGARGVHPACLALNHSADPRENLRRALEQAKRIDGTFTEADLVAGMAADPWTRATYQQHAPQTTREMDAEECSILGTRMVPLTNPQGWFIFDETAWSALWEDC